MKLQVSDLIIFCWLVAGERFLLKISALVPVFQNSKKSLEISSNFQRKLTRNVWNHSRKGPVWILQNLNSPKIFGSDRSVFSAVSHRTLFQCLFMCTVFSTNKLTLVICAFSFFALNSIPQNRAKNRRNFGGGPEPGPFQNEVKCLWKANGTLTPAKQQQEGEDTAFGGLLQLTCVCVGGLGFFFVRRGEYQK